MSPSPRESAWDGNGDVAAPIEAYALQVVFGFVFGFGSLKKRKGGHRWGGVSCASGARYRPMS